MKQIKLFLILIFCRLSRILLRAMYIYPIRQNRVLFVSFRGKQYSCNPRAVSEALKGLAGDALEIVWAFHEPEKFSFLRDQGISVIGDRSFDFIKTALTAKVVCTNTYYKPFLPRRKGQFFIQTWHGGGAYKRVGKLEKMPPLRRKFIALQQDQVNLYLSSSKAFTRLTVREAFGYTGEVYEHGMPRNDCLMKPAPDSIIKKVHDQLSLPPDTSIALYAPTFRPDDRAYAYGLDFDGVKHALEKRFGGKWEVAFRGHHVVTGTSGASIDATDYMDMQELLLASGALITDYSSSIWDMSLAKKPVFLYATDLQEYTFERDFFTDIHTWPFPLSENNDELTENILNFDEDKYLKDIARHHEELEISESGRASEYTAKRILRECRTEEKK
ncbi:MAG: CDP-glycerol glycerophosphotransferase family protein [Clostridia bacterium]|nr:CDP-glycerol glycerophosphotransferase family protein [Clostridia bacterium]